MQASSHRRLLTLCATALLLTVPLLRAAETPAGEHPSIKRPYNLAPPVDLAYSIKAKQRGISLNGTASVQWRSADGKYSVNTESRLSLLGKILENRSEGALDDFGPDAYLGAHSLAPDSAPLDPGPDPHSAMEAALRLGTAPVSRRV